MVERYNTDVDDRRCAGGFVRVRGRCSGAVGSQSLPGCEGCEVTKGNDVMAASLKTVSAWRGLFLKKRDQIMMMTTIIIMMSQDNFNHNHTNKDNYNNL